MYLYLCIYKICKTYYYLLQKWPIRARGNGVHTSAQGVPQRQEMKCLTNIKEGSQFSLVKKSCVQGYDLLRNE